MKTINLNKVMQTLLLLFTCVLVSAVAIVGNTNKAYADDNCEEQMCADDVNYNFDSCDNQDENSDDPTINCFPINHTKYDDTQCTSTGDIYGIRYGKYNRIIKYFNVNGQTSPFIFDYNYYCRSFGENTCSYGQEKDNVQWLFNSSTGELAVLMVENTKRSEAGTFGYSWWLDGHTLNKTVTFAEKDIKNINVGNNVKILYIDPQLYFIGSQSFKNSLPNCECVDMCNHIYNCSNLGKGKDTGTKSLRAYCFEDLAKSLNFPCETPFLNVFTKSELDDMRARSGKDDPFSHPNYVIRDDNVGWVYRHINADAGVASVTDSQGTSIENLSRYWVGEHYYFKVNVKPNSEILEVRDNNEVLTADWDGYYTLDHDKYSRHIVTVKTISKKTFSITGQIHNQIGISPGFVKVDIIDENNNVLATQAYSGSHMRATRYTFNNLVTTSSKIKVRCYEYSDNDFTTNWLNVKDNMEVDINLPD